MSRVTFCEHCKMMVFLQFTNTAPQMGHLLAQRDTGNMKLRSSSLCVRKWELTLRTEDRGSVCDELG